MKFLPVDPSPDIRQFITGYYFIENTTLTHDSIPPLGFPVIQFHLKNNIDKFYAKYDFPTDDVMIIGQLSKYAKIDQIEGSQMIGVNLHPTTLHKLTNQPVNQFSDKGTPAVQFFGNAIIQMYNQLKTLKEESHKIELLNKYFSELILSKKLETDKFDQLIDTIWLKEGNITEKEIYDLLPTSRRTIQRYFIQRIGLPMKTYLRVIRHLNFHKRAQLKQNAKLSQIIYECGYYDSSHFTKDFKLLSDETPTNYFQKHEEFSHLLIQI